MFNERAFKKDVKTIFRLIWPDKEANDAIKNEISNYSIFLLFQFRIRTITLNNVLEYRDNKFVFTRYFLMITKESNFFIFHSILHLSSFNIWFFSTDIILKNVFKLRFIAEKSCASKKLMNNNRHEDEALFIGLVLNWQRSTGVRILLAFASTNFIC